VAGLHPLKTLLCLKTIPKASLAPNREEFIVRSHKSMRIIAGNQKVRALLNEASRWSGARRQKRWTLQMKQLELTLVAANEATMLTSPAFAQASVMEKRTGWGTELPPAKRNGEWEFQAFGVDRSLNRKNLDRCFSCH
jgi:hypothetical protein